jgi:hypothetical protein
MDIRFKIDPERMTLGDLIVIEEPQATTWREKREMMSHHMVDENGEFIDPGEARGILSKLNMVQLGIAAQAFRAQMEELNKSQLPPASGRP